MVKFEKISRKEKHTIRIGKSVSVKHNIGHHQELLKTRE
jgi:hypothetical protein